jgi:heterodisulfide reductase subunit C
VTIRESELDRAFRHRVAAHPNGASIVKCFACGACTAGCSIRELDVKYSPRKIIHQILLGMREEVYRNEFVWMCASHYSCFLGCAQKVNIKEIMHAIRCIAEREGTSPGNGDLDHDFKYEIIAQPGGEGIMSCFACGACPSGCPEQREGSDYDSQEIIRMALLGMRDEVLSSRFIRACSEHFRCYARCPLGVRINEIMYAVKSLALEDGCRNPLLRDRSEGGSQAGTIDETGK